MVEWLDVGLHELNSSQQKNMDAGVRHLYIHISIIEPNYK